MILGRNVSNRVSYSSMHECQIRRRKVDNSLAISRKTERDARRILHETRSRTAAQTKGRGKGGGDEEKVQELVLIPRGVSPKGRLKTGSFIFHRICGKMQMRGASGNNGHGLRPLF